MLKFLGVLITFQSLNTQIYSSYVFVNEKNSWFAALDVCHTRFNGTLSALPLHETEKLQQCIGKKRIWTGHYREVSKWMSMKGCFSLSIQNVTTMKDVSAQACQKYCSDSSTFAARGKTCACNVQLNSARRTNDSLCNITCDTRAFCGGKDDVFSGYQSASKPTTNEYEKQCALYRCRDNSINIYGKDCTRKRSVRCANNATISGTFDWNGGLKECISSHQRVIMHMENISQCYDGIGNEAFWNGIFRAERERQTSVLPTLEWDQPDPIRSMSAKFDDQQLSDRLDPPEKKLWILCETEDATLDLSNYCVAPSSLATTSSVAIMTSTPGTTSSDVISKTSSMISSTDYLFTSTKVMTSSTEDVSPPPKAPLQQQESSDINTSLIGGLAGGIAVAITVVIIGIFVCYKRKRKSPGQEFDDKKPVFNPGYGAPVIPGGNVNNYYNIQNTHNDDVNPPADDYFILEKPNDAAGTNLNNEDDGGDYFILEKSKASEEIADDTNGQYSNVDAQRGDNPNFTPTTNRQDDDDTYARSVEGDYDHLNNSQARRNVTMDTDEMYDHAKPSHKEESEYDKVRNLEEEITPYGYVSVGENSI